MLFFSMRERTFKTAWFAKVARKARISDRDLCKAIQQVALGQADDLGGGVFKKRLNENRHRSIVLAKAGELPSRIGQTLTKMSWMPSASSRNSIAGKPQKNWRPS